MEQREPENITEAQKRDGAIENEQKDSRDYFIIDPKNDLDINLVKKYNYFIKNDFVVIDLETTGLSPDDNEILEIGALKIINNEVVGEYNTLCKPNRRIPQKITDINGIDNEMVEDAPKIKKIFGEFIDFIGASVLLGHNVGFDCRFLDAVYSKYFHKNFENITTIDTLKMARTLIPKLNHHTLSGLKKYFNITGKEAHRALGDCYSTLAVYNQLKNMIINNKIDKDGTKQLKIKIEPDSGMELIDKHFFYQNLGERFYKKREENTGYLNMVIEICKRQIGISKEAAEYFKNAYPNMKLPGHYGYKQLCVIMEKSGNIEEAINIAENAKLGGWNGDWEKRIEKLNKIQMKSM